jgi:UDP-N-acetylglucosamine 2-epimerase (non-hydrolysing)
LKTIHLIAAARPNFMKIAPLYHALKQADWAEPVIVHTGQHYDVNMSDAFFRDLMLPEPHHHLGVGSGTHAEQTGKVMIAYEKLLVEKRPDLVVVVGDVNSTLACTLAASKISYGLMPSAIGPAPGVQDLELDPQGPEPGTQMEPGTRNPANRPLVAHLEAGLRSFDRTMPEEINRIVTDSIADILWTPSPDADENLLREGVAPGKIEQVGNIMIDSLEMMRPRIMAENVAAKYGLHNRAYGVVTLHRPSNVDHPATLKKLCDALQWIAADLPLIFPVHPRTRKNLEAFGLYNGLAATPGISLDDPLSYIPFMSLVFNCRLVITDSGGIQEETTYLGIPCLTLRSNTERPITVTQGTNRLCTPENIATLAKSAMADQPGANPPLLWDGRTSQRVTESARRFIFHEK